MAKERHREVPASYLVLIKDGKILLARRFNTGYMDGNYSLPAGHVDKGETFAQCMIREVKEEIGINVKPEDSKTAHLMHRFSGAEWGDEGYRIDVFFTADKWQGNPEIKEPDKCDELSWFELGNLPQNIIPYVRQALECINKKIFYSEFGWENLK
ncbi:MAG: NUDIX domain-containing protein [Candidatus Staskawiczbacteria bacterium]|nr:NUDIX domain-containing protein [Candidatus Staskawiczbacteria bacterium]